MKESTAPTGAKMLVPEDIHEDGVSFRPDEAVAARAYYLEHGYTIFRSLLEPGDCLRVMAAFNREVRPFPGLIRRIDFRLDTNHFNAHGHLTNPILSIQDAPRWRFRGYRSSVLDLLTRSPLQGFLRSFFGPKIRLITFNHFEANPETAPHQDCYFWGELEVGRVVGVWVALEDIDADAGRLYVVPGSHRIDLRPYARSVGFTGQGFAAADPGYQKILVDFLRTGDLPWVAPCLRKGDVLFWDSRTVHGSLKTTDPRRSRSSLTAHYTAEPTTVVAATGREFDRNGITISRSPYYFTPAMVRAGLRLKFPGIHGLARRLAGRR